MSYRLGTDLILGVVQDNAFLPLGYSSGCKITDSTETGERATKENETSGWKEHYVKSLAEQITADGFVYDNVAAGKVSFPDLKSIWLAKEPVKLRYKYRDGEELYEGDFIITSLEQDGPAGDDEKWSITFENTGAIQSRGGASNSSNSANGVGESGVVSLFSAKLNLTDAEKEMARRNIGAATSNGEEPALVAGDLVSPSDRVTVSEKFLIRTTAGDESIDSNKDALLMQVIGGDGFKINALRWNGANALNPSEWQSGMTSGYLTGKIGTNNKVQSSGGRKLCIIRTPKCEAGEWGTSAKNNGWLLTDSDGNNLQAGTGIVYGVWHSPTLPATGTTVTAVTGHTFDGHSEVFYLPDEGYMIVEIAASAELSDVSVHMAWSKDYDKFEAYSAPVELVLAVSPLTTVFDTETINGKTCLVLRGGSQINSGVHDWIIINEDGGGSYERNIVHQLLTNLTWTESQIEGSHVEGEMATSGYRYTAPLPTTGTYAAMTDGFMQSEIDGMILNGTTLQFDSATQITPATAFSSKYADYQMANPVGGVHTIDPTGKTPNDMGTEEVIGGDEATGTIVISYMRGFKDSTRAMMNEFKAAMAQLTELGYSKPLYRVGAWLDNANNAGPNELDNPDALAVMGSADWAADWRPFLVDMTAVAGEIKKRPVAELRKNNLLRDIYGNWAPVVGITSAMRNECMGNALYTDAACTTQYCASGAYDPEAFLALCSIQTVDGAKKLTHPKLYKAANTEVTHYLMPWETTETKYSIFVGRKDEIYLLDNVVGASGKEWNGVLGANVNVWDGVDVKMYALKPTGICPSPVTAISENSTTKARSFYFAYPASVNNAKGLKGTATNCEMFYGKAHMPECYATQPQTKNRARANNSDTTKPFPFAEGGYHARNALLRCVEVMTGSKNLCAADRFGMSGHNTCNSEATWRANGGARWRNTGDTAWNYTPWGSSSGIYKNASGGRDAITVTLNNYAAHMPTMEAQIAVSFAVEFGIGSGETFEFMGNQFRWEAISTGTFAPKSPAQGQMNCRLYKLVSGTFSAHNSSGAAQSFDVECMVLTGLMLGCDMGADAAVYWGGGCEIVGQCTTAHANNSLGHEIVSWIEPDQEKWTNEDDIDINIGQKFAFENSYKRAGSIVTRYNGYTRRRLPYTPLPAAMGGGYTRGECGYSYVGNYWGTVGKKTRICLLCGDAAGSDNLSARLVNMNNAASKSNQNICGSAQVMRINNRDARIPCPEAAAIQDQPANCIVEAGDKTRLGCLVLPRLNTC